MLINYRKTHLYDPSKEFERLAFTAGNELGPIVTYKDIKIGLLICFDIELVEPTRILAVQGAEVVIVPTANTDVIVSDVIVRCRAIENHIFVAYVNHVGIMKKLNFCGQSIIVSPVGEVISSSDEKEMTLTAEISPDEEKYSHRRAYAPLLEDRRPELYNDLIKPL